jgi:hypothetical protein
MRPHRGPRGRGLPGINCERSEVAGRSRSRRPEVRDIARANRDFLRRAVRYLAVERGITQFLDVGTGIPTSPNVHETAAACARETRVVYADNDPVVHAHTSDFPPADVTSTVTSAYEGAAAPLVLRPRAAIESFFDGFTLEPPGLVQAPLWHPDVKPKPKDLKKIGIYAAVSAKD